MTTSLILWVLVSMSPAGTLDFRGQFWNENACQDERLDYIVQHKWKPPRLTCVRLTLPGDGKR